MKWFLKLIFLCGMKMIYCYSNENPKNETAEVNNLLSKILQADKFNELVDRIAERAVMKLNDYRRPTFKSVLATDDGMHSSKMKTSNNEVLNYSFGKSRGQSRHKHGKIDVDAVLKKTASPLNGLKLRYKELKKKYAKPALRMKDTNIMENDPKHIEDYNKFAQDVQLDFDQNIKTLSDGDGDEDFKNPFGDGETISWNKKPTTRVEGDKRFAFVESPDYSDYHDKRAEAQFDSSKKFSYSSLRYL